MEKIGIDARKLSDYGIGTHISNLLINLSKLDKEREYFIFCNQEDAHLVNDLAENFHVTIDNSTKYSLQEHISLSWKIKKLKLNLFHEPHYVLPLFTSTPNYIVTIHDLIHLLFPQYLPNRRAYYYARYMLKKAVTRSTQIIAVSQSTKSDIQRHLFANPDKIKVIYNGVEENFFNTWSSHELKSTKERYQLFQPFILYVGNLKPHKNLTCLIESFRLIKEEVENKLQLIIVGRDVVSYPELKRSAEKLGLRQAVRFLGFIPKNLLPGLYRLAKIFVFPSLYEGFGLPPIEAMACGTPVVAAKTSSLPEILGEAAFLTEVNHPSTLADAITKVLKDDNLRNNLSELGPKQAHKFSWDKTAQEVLTLYRETMQK
jgi:glycosyltransferase involved in cell wall biosynthesis